jgi:hypothetical protein
MPINRISVAAFAVSVFGVVSICRGETIVDASVCELLSNPDAYNHQLIRIGGRVKFGMETFTLSSSACGGPLKQIWLTYGGTLKSGAIKEGWAPRRPESLTVDGFQTSLKEDAEFLRFRSSLMRSLEKNLDATVVGRYFAGKPAEGGAPEFRGYGMWGMYSMLVIQEVISSEMSAH